MLNGPATLCVLTALMLGASVAVAVAANETSDGGSAHQPHGLRANGSVLSQHRMADAVPTLTWRVQRVVDVQASGDAKKGEKVFKNCRACHATEAGKNGVGPSLSGIMGRLAGTVEGFAFSDAMVESGLTWDPDTMAAFLAKPTDIVPGTRMAFRGIRRPAEISDLIAYLNDL